MSKYSVGDRIITPAKKLGEVSSVHSKKITIVWENGLSAEYTPKQLQAWNYQKFLEEGAFAECNSHNLTSAQELVQAHLDLTLSEPQRLTNTAQISLNCDIQKLTTTETCKVSRNAPPGSIPVDTFAASYAKTQKLFIQE